MKHVIVGGVAGGATAAARLRRLDETAEIILIERGEHISYANCGLPYYIGGVIQERDRLFVQTPEAFSTRFRIDVRVRSEVMAIDTARKEVKVRTSDGKEYIVKKHYIQIAKPNQIRYSILPFKTMYLKFSACDELAERLAAQRVSLSEQAKSELTVIGEAVSEIVRLTVEAFTKDDNIAARRVEPLEEPLYGYGTCCVGEEGQFVKVFVRFPLVLLLRYQAHQHRFFGAGLRYHKFFHSVLRKL